MMAATNKRPRRRKDRPPVTIIGVTKDIYGNTWSVNEYIPTKHKFKIAKGWMKGYEPGPGMKSGRASTILTPSLVKYLREITNFKDISLPLSDAKISRLRKMLKVDAVTLRRKWWESKKSDMHKMTIRSFAKKYGVSATSSYAHFHGYELRKNRPAGWWREMAVAKKILMLPGQEAADLYGLSINTIYTLRRKLRTYK